MKRPSEWGRRTYLRGIAAAGIAGSVPVAASAAHEYDEDDEPDPHDVLMGHPFVGDLDGLNADLGDDVGDMEFNVKNRYEGDPASGDREWPLHYTTDGVETQDYPATLINIHKHLDKEVRLRDLQRDGERKGELTFEYYVGPDHDQYIPGQVYLVIQTQEQADKSEKKRVYGLYKNVRKGEDYRGAWHTLDVVEEMAGDGTDADWHVLSLPIDPEEFREELSFETFADAILQQAIMTRDGEGMMFHDIFEESGWDEDAQLLAFGLGSGSSRSASKRDIYYDNYRLAAKDQEHSFDLPAALEMDATPEGRGQIPVTLTFQTEQEGVDLADVDEDSIRLYPFAQIQPPQDENEGVGPSFVGVHDGRIEARFPPGQVRELNRLGPGQGRRVVVAGRFDYEHVVWFFGHTDVDIPGR